MKQLFSILIIIYLLFLACTMPEEPSRPTTGAKELLSVASANK